jgi:hypothetical protein
MRASKERTAHILLLEDENWIKILNHFASKKAGFQAGLKNSTKYT